MKNNHFFDRDIVTIKDFSKADLEFVFDATDKVSSLKPKERGQLASARTLGYIFYEPRYQNENEF